jgi:hypothetical protein
MVYFSGEYFFGSGGCAPSVEHDRIAIMRVNATRMGILLKLSEPRN